MSLSSSPRSRGFSTALVPKLVQAPKESSPNSPTQQFHAVIFSPIETKPAAKTAQRATVKIRNAEKIQIEGFILKEAEKGVKKKWNQRWAYIKGKNMYYINKKKNVQTKVIKGANIIAVRQLEPTEASKNAAYIFEIQTTKKCLRFCAASQQEQEKWCHALFHLISECEIEETLDESLNNLMQHLSFDARHFSAVLLQKIQERVPAWKEDETFRSEVKAVLDDLALERRYQRNIQHDVIQAKIEKALEEGNQEEEDDDDEE